MQHRSNIQEIITILKDATRHMEPPASYNIVQRFGQDPFLILIGCILSLRTRDSTSFPASVRLFEYAKTPQEMQNIDCATIERLIYPVMYYRRKAITIHAVSRIIIEQYDGHVPADKQLLMSMPGVGLKTANLVLGEAFNIPAICVDVHVHRISNRLGIVQTSTVEETEQALQTLVPQDQWILLNRLLVMWGQNICVPVSPKCSQCPLYAQCERVGVTHSR